MSPEPSFIKFSDFLAHVGPKPHPKATLDRIDNNDREYAPGKVRWADKRTQNSNKGDTRFFNCSRTGATHTVRRLAKSQKKSASAIGKRAERGWAHDQIIAGRRWPEAAPTLPVDTKPSKQEPDLRLPLEITWYQVTTAARRGECCTLTPTEKGMLNNLAAFCRTAGLLYYAEDMFRYVLDRWTDYAAELCDEHGVYNPPTVPSLGVLAKYPRQAVNFRLRANDLELKHGVPVPAPPKPRPESANTNDRRRAEPVQREVWDDRSWGEVLPDSYEDDSIFHDRKDGQEAHAFHVIHVWKAWQADHEGHAAMGDRNHLRARRHVSGPPPLPPRG